MKRLGKMIRIYREKKQMTVQDVAEALGVNERLVTKWEKGRAMPDASMIEKLSTLLDIPSSAWISATMQRLEGQKRSLLITVLALLLAVLLALGGIGLYARQILERMEYVLYGGFGSLASNYAVDVSMTELIATPERYHGVKVRLTAVGNLEFEGNCISVSKEAWENYTNDSIWIELGDELAPYYERLQRYNGEYVIIEGVFDMYDKGHFDSFQGALHNVTRYDLNDSDLFDNCEALYCQESGLYSYTVYDDRGNVMISGENLERYPKRHYVGMGVIGVSVPSQGDASVYRTVYCHVESGRVSEPFVHVLEAQEGCVVYLTEIQGQYSIAVQDIFDPTAYYQTYPLEDYNPEAERPIMSQKDDVSGKVEIYYKSGESEEEKTLTVYLP